MTVIPRVGTGVDVHAFGEEGTPSVYCWSALAG